MRLLFFIDKMYALIYKNAKIISILYGKVVIGYEKRTFSNVHSVNFSIQSKAAFCLTGLVMLQIGIESLSEKGIQVMSMGLL